MRRSSSAQCACGLHYIVWLGLVTLLWCLQFDLIQDNLKYFLEIIQNKKSDFLEYMIVVLIAAEIFVSLFDMWSRV